MIKRERKWAGVVGSVVLPAVLLGWMAGCAPKVETATVRSPLAASEVTLFSKPPKEFENHGIVMSEPIESIPDGWKADAVVAELKAAAGAKGANGILITPMDKWKEYETSDKRYVYVGAFYEGQFFAFPMTTEKPRRMGAIAIYVIEK